MPRATGAGWDRRTARPGTFLPRAATAPHASCPALTGLPSPTMPGDTRTVREAACELKPCGSPVRVSDGTATTGRRARRGGGRWSRAVRGRGHFTLAGPAVAVYRWPLMRPACASTARRPTPPDSFEPSIAPQRETTRGAGPADLDTRSFFDSVGWHRLRGLPVRGVRAGACPVRPVRGVLRGPFPANAEPALRRRLRA